MSTPDGTDLMAERFSALGVGEVCFEAPAGARANWLPLGYVLVTDPDEILTGLHCVLPRLSNDWMPVSDINSGTRIGRRAADSGKDVLYVAKPNELEQAIADCQNTTNTLNLRAAGAHALAAEIVRLRDVISRAKRESELIYYNGKSVVAVPYWFINS
jgi:hypothetical protein